MNREEAPGKSPEDMYIQQKVRVLLMLKKMGSNVRRFSRQPLPLRFGASPNSGLSPAHHLNCSRIYRSYETSEEVLPLVIGRLTSLDASD